MVLYRAGLRRQHHCPAWALVFSPEPKVRTSVCERMFREPIIRDLDTAIANYPWAVLAAAVHRAGPDAVTCATVAIKALLHVAPEDYGRYIQLVSASVGKDVMQQVRGQLPKNEREELSQLIARAATITTIAELFTPS